LVRGITSVFGILNLHPFFDGKISYIQSFLIGFILTGEREATRATSGHVLDPAKKHAPRNGLSGDLCVLPTTIDIRRLSKGHLE